MFLFFSDDHIGLSCCTSVFVKFAGSLSFVSYIFTDLQYCTQGLQKIFVFSVVDYEIMKIPEYCQITVT